MSEGRDGRVELVLGFLNTLDLEAGTDRLESPEAYAGWLAEADLPAPAAERRDLNSALALRTALRSAAAGEVVSVPPEVPVTVTVTESGRPAFAAADALGRLAAAVATLAVDGRWERVKICPADDCRWAFYDESRNRSRQWCSMSVCGNRAKARSYRRRQDHVG